MRICVLYIVHKIPPALHIRQFTMPVSVTKTNNEKQREFDSYCVSVKVAEAGRKKHVKQPISQTKL
jgi:hypothetical protein